MRMYGIRMLRTLALGNESNIFLAVWLHRDDEKKVLWLKEMNTTYTWIVATVS